MANIILSLADTAGFVPQAWANTALKVLRNNIALTKVVARDSDFTDAGWRGKSLTVPYPGTFAAQPKVANTVATVQTPTGGQSVTVTLGQPQTVDFIIEDVAFAQALSGMALMDNYGSAAGVALAEKVESDLMAAIIKGLTGAPASNGAQPGAVATNINYAAVVQARKALVDGKAPQNDRSLILNTKDYAAALQDSALLGYFQFQNPGAFTDAQPGRVAGFDLYESQLTPIVDGTALAHSIQAVSITGAPTGGTFTLTYKAQTTAAIPFNATARQVENALAALSTIGAGAVRCSGGPLPATAIQVVLLADAAPAVFTHADSLTGGTTPAVAIADNTGVASLNLAIHKNALIVAFRPLQTITTPGVEVAYAVDPTSGLMIRVQMQVKPEFRGLYVAYDILYGFQILRPTQGVVVLG